MQTIQELYKIILEIHKGYTKYSRGNIDHTRLTRSYGDITSYLWCYKSYKRSYIIQGLYMSIYKLEKAIQGHTSVIQVSY